MRLRYIWTLCIVGALLGIAGCDPAALVKSKVPGPIKTILTFEGVGRVKPIKEVTVVHPKPNSVYGSDETIAFQVDVDTGNAKLPVSPSVSWSARSLVDRKKKDVGSSAKCTKKLEAGQYEAQVTVEALGQKISKKVAFRVVLRMPGKIVSPDQKGIGGVEIVTTDIANGTEFSRTATDTNGAFNVEVPANRAVVVTPRKAGLSFYPLSHTVEYSPARSVTQFTGIEAVISNIRLASVQDPAAGATGLCPGEQMLLSFQIQAKTPPKSFEVALVRQEKEAEQVIRLDQERDAAISQAAGSVQSKALKVRLSTNARLGTPMWTGHIRVTVNDDMGERYSVDSAELITVDLTGCFNKASDRATAALSDGKLGVAVTEFTDAEKLARQLDASPEVAATLRKVNLNRALALLMGAQAEKPKSRQQKALLENAVLDLNNLLRSQEGDSAALFLKGLADYLAQDYRAALKDFEGVLLVQSANTEANLLRAIACLKTGLKKNVSIAIDDLTQILTTDPSNAELRKTRAAALKIFVQYQDRKADERIDTADIPVPSISEVMDLKKYVHK